jgi:cell fate regulator YaaT (PSP1 superfamily)
VRLRHPGQFYDFDAGDLELSPGDWVIVDKSRGQDIGQVVLPCREIASEDIPGDLKSVVRLAHEGDFRKMERFQEKEREVLARAQEKVDAAELPMRLVKAEYSYNGRSLKIYFSAEKRVDFRKLVKQLAREFRTRIELRQIGARDEARLLGGIGNCGRELCCITWLQEFLRISVRMAKDQDLPLSPMKISGVCGRLLCCLSYECDQYRAIKAELPKVGEQVVTLHGKGKVVGVNVPKEAVTVEIHRGLTVEASAQELAEAKQLAAEGKLQPVPLTAGAIHIGRREASSRSRQTAASASTPSPSSKKSRRRRRRKKSSGSRPAKGKQPAKDSQQQDPSRSSKRRRRRPSKTGGGEQSKTEGQPATSKQRQSESSSQKKMSSSSRRRRHPRRRRPQKDKQ